MSTERNYPNEYRQRLPLFNNLTNKASSLLSELMKLHDINVHAVEARTKSVESFLAKISKPTRHYNDPFTEIDDISAVRLIVYYNDDVEKAVAIIKTEFSIQEQEEISSRMDADQFGYRSVHLVASLRPDRAKLLEWRQFSTLRFEIQVRTVLQHAWAAVSHVLQYKTELDAPAVLRRRLSRLAGLFELADEEFVGIRREHASLASETKRAVSEGDRTVEIDYDIVEAFITTSDTIKGAIDYALMLGFDLGSEEEDDEDDERDSIRGLIRQARAVGINSLRELESAIDIDYTSYLKTIWASHEGGSSTGWSVSSAFIAHLLLIRARIERFKVRMLVADGWTNDIAKLVLEAARMDASKNRRRTLGK